MLLTLYEDNINDSFECILIACLQMGYLQIIHWLIYIYVTGTEIRLGKR